MKNITKIAVLVFLQIVIIATSFIVLIMFEKEKAGIGNTIDLVGKNRYLGNQIMMTILEYDEKKDHEKLSKHIEEIERNLSSIKDGNKERGIPPLVIELYPQWASTQESFEEFNNKVSEFSSSQKNLDQVLMSNMEFVDSVDRFINILSEYAVTKSDKTIMSEIVFLAVNSVVLIVLAYLIYQMLSKEKEQKNNLLKQDEGRKEKILEIEQIQTALDKVAIVVITDKNGNITYTNERFCEISKYRKNELIGKNHRILKSGFHYPEFYKNLWKTISSGNVWSGEIKNKAKDGSFYWVNSTIVPLKDKHEKITQYIAIGIDITEMKRLGEEIVKKERFAAIGQLASRLAHDLRNPLAIIINGLELIKETTNEEFTKENCERMDKSVERMKHQIGDVLDFVRVKPYVFEKIELHELLKKATADLHIPSSIKLNITDRNPTIVCDIEKLVNVFANIIHNALEKLTIKGSIDIHYSDDGSNHRLKITDSGESIPRENLEKIFEPLFTTKEHGTGLGLAGCKQIITRHNGRIFANNHPTTFTIIIPKEIKNESNNS